MKNKPLTIITFFSLIIFIGFFPSIKIMQLSKVIAFFPFLLVGYLLPAQFMRHIKESRFEKILAIILTIVFAYIIWYLRDLSINDIFLMLKPYNRFEDDFKCPMPIWGRIIFIVSSFLMIFSVLNLIPKKRTIFTKIGQRSLYVFVLHAIFVVIVRSLDFYYNIFDLLSSPQAKVIYLISCIIIGFLLSSDLVFKIFRPMLNPEFDIEKLFSLFIKTKSDSKNQD